MSSYAWSMTNVQWPIDQSLSMISMNFLERHFMNYKMTTSFFQRYNFKAQLLCTDVHSLNFIPITSLPYISVYPFCKLDCHYNECGQLREKRQIAFLITTRFNLILPRIFWSFYFKFLLKCKCWFTVGNTLLNQ